jgi:hypothetical protein
MGKHFLFFFFQLKLNVQKGFKRSKGFNVASK